MAKKLDSMIKEVSEWDAKAATWEADIEAERKKVDELQTTIADKVMTGGDKDALGTELEHAKRRYATMETTYQAIISRLKDKKAAVEQLRLQDAKDRQAELKKQADQAELDYVKAYKAAWEASLKMAQLSRQEQAEFCGPFRLQAQIDGGRWSNEAQKLESYIDGTLGLSNPDLNEKAGLSSSERSKIKAQLE